jgi:signal transduction histidine kinase/CheY-like chemotaxis protein
VATILHINHDDTAQELIQNELGQNYNLITATNAPTAIQYCAMIQPDLILLDVELPKADVRELALRLKMFMPQTPIISFVPDNGLGVPLVEADGTMSKPVDLTDLQRRIQSLLPQPSRVLELALSGLRNHKAIEQFESQIDLLYRANKRLAALNTISALIGTSLDLEHLMDQILTEIDKTIQFDSATLFLLKGNLLEAAASRGLSDHRRGMNVFTKSERNSAWRVVENKLPLIINNVQASEFWEPRPELSKVRSWLGVPLIYKDRVVGVLTLDKNEIHGFAESDARYVFTLAFQIAITVENAQLFEEWENQATRLKLINEVAQEITTILEVNNLYEALAWALFERLNYDRVAVLEVNNPGETLTLRAYYGQPRLHLVVGVYQHSPGTGLIGQALKAAMPLLISGVSGETQIKSLTGDDVESQLVIPITVENRIEAVINIESSDPDEFTDQDLWTLSSLANQAATVVANARLYQDVDAYSNKLERIVEGRTQRLQAIRQISQIVSQGLDLEELESELGQRISQIFTPAGSDAKVRVILGQINGSRLSVKTIYKRGSRDNGSRATLPDGVFRMGYDSPAGQVIHESKPLILANSDFHSIYAGLPVETGVINSVMMAPLVTAGKTIGTVSVESLQPNAFDDSDLETLETLAFQIATSIEHARLIRKTRELAVVDERTRLARDMHDGVAQNLAYLMIQVDRCLNQVHEGSKLEKQLEQISLLLKQNIEEIRRNIFDLRPMELEGRSLFEVLESFVAEFGRRWSIKTSCTIVGEADEVPTEVESSLYRIVQETLSNIRQHARCTQVSVELVVDEIRGITLEIKDDGQGFDLSQAHLARRKSSGSRGLGLISMRERAQGANGQLVVESVVGQGTRIFAVFPPQDTEVATYSE